MSSSMPGCDYIKDTGLYTDILDPGAPRDSPSVRPAFRGRSPAALPLVALVAGLVVLCALTEASAGAGSQRVTLPDRGRRDAGSATWYEPSVAACARGDLRSHAAEIRPRLGTGRRRRWPPKASAPLPLDLRGHGESPGSPQDYSGMVQDVRAARRFLSSRGDVAPGRIAIAGASIGASLAALAAADDPSVVSLALLSPSLDYRGLRLDAAVRKYRRAAGAARRERRRWLCGAVGARTAEGGRRCARGGHPQPCRPRHGDADKRCRSRPAPAGVVPTNAAMIGRRSSESLPSV